MSGRTLRVPSYRRGTGARFAKTRKRRREGAEILKQCPKDGEGARRVCHEDNRMEAIVGTPAKWSVMNDLVGESMTMIDKKNVLCSGQYLHRYYLGIFAAIVLIERYQDSWGQSEHLGAGWTSSWG